MLPFSFGTAVVAADEEVEEAVSVAALAFQGCANCCLVEAVVVVVVLQ